MTSFFFPAELDSNQIFICSKRTYMRLCGHVLPESWLLNIYQHSTECEVS